MYKVETVLFPDDTNILIKAESDDILNYKINRIM
jgi:hypothetical protein